jgi:hypothetical protein
MAAKDMPTMPTIAATTTPPRIALRLQPVIQKAAIQGCAILTMVMA